MRFNNLATNRRKQWQGLLLGLLFSGLALAQAPAAKDAVVVTQANPTLRIQIGTGAPRPLLKDEVIPAGALVTSGAAAGAVLTFADGMTVVLGEWTRLQVAEFRYLPNDPGKSSVRLVLAEGTARILTGAIGQRNAALIQLQVGEGIVPAAVANRPRGSDMGVVVVQTAAMLQVAQGRATLTSAGTGRSYPLGAGQNATIQSDGSVRLGGAQQPGETAEQIADAKEMLERLARMNSLKLPVLPGQTVITLSTPASEFAAGEPAELAPVTAATGAGSGSGGGIASPN